jgi:hypothetical protein
LVTNWVWVALRGVDEEVVLLHRREAAAGGDTTN